MNPLCALLLASALAPQLGAPPKARVVLLADRDAYASLEPVRLTVTVHNEAGFDLVLEHRTGEPAAWIELFRVGADGALEPFGAHWVPMGLLCGTEPPPEIDEWRLAAGGSVLCGFWLDQELAVGTHRFRVVFRPDDAARIEWRAESADLVLRIEAPSGRDRAAYEYLASPEPAEVDGLRYYTTPAGKGGLSPGAASPEVVARFLELHGESLYADYARRNRALGLHAFAENGRKAELLRAVLERGRPGFPFRPECYVVLQELAQEVSDVETAVALRAAREAERFERVDPYLATRIARLDAWLDAPPEELAAARRAHRTYELALAHPYVQELARAHSGQVQRPELEPDRARLWFDDLAAGRPVGVSFQETPAGARLELHGSLRSLAHGRLATAVLDLERELGLTPEQSLRAFAELDWRGDRLEGTVKLPSGGSAPVSFRLAP